MKIYRFIPISINISDGILAEMDNLLLKFLRKCKRTRISKIILKKNKAGCLILFNFKSFYKTTIINTVWYWHMFNISRIVLKNKSSYLWSISWQRWQNNWMEKEQHFQQMAVGQLDIHTHSTRSWSPSLHHTQKLT